MLNSASGSAGGMDWLQAGGLGLENRFQRVKSNITASDPGQPIAGLS